MSIGITYKVWTLGDLISALEALGDKPVSGFLPLIYSYRGYYDRPSVEPGNVVYSANDLASSLRGEVGGTMYGWKGGEFPITENSYVHLANWGDTGPNFLGLFYNTDSEVYEPILLQGDWY